MDVNGNFALGAAASDGPIRMQIDVEGQHASICNVELGPAPHLSFLGHKANTYKIHKSFKPPIKSKLEIVCHDPMSMVSDVFEIWPDSTRTGDFQTNEVVYVAWPKCEVVKDTWEHLVLVDTLRHVTYSGDPANNKRVSHSNTAAVSQFEQMGTFAPLITGNYDYEPLMVNEKEVCVKHESPPGLADHLPNCGDAYTALTDNTTYERQESIGHIGGPSVE